MEEIQLDQQLKDFLRGVPYQRCYRLRDPSTVSLIDLEKLTGQRQGDTVVVIYKDAILYNNHRFFCDFDARSRFGVNDLGQVWSINPRSAVEALLILTRLHRGTDDCFHGIRLERHNIAEDGTMTSQDLQELHRCLGDRQYVSFQNFYFQSHQFLPLADLDEPIYLQINNSFCLEEITKLTDAIVLKRRSNNKNSNQDQKKNPQQEETNSFGRLRYTCHGRLFSDTGMEEMKGRKSILFDELSLIDIPESLVDLRLFECSESIHRLVVDIEPDAPDSDNDSTPRPYAVCAAAARAIQRGVSPRRVRVIDYSEQVAIHGEDLMVAALATPGCRVHELCFNPSVVGDVMIPALRANDSLRNVVFCHSSFDDDETLQGLVPVILGHPTLEIITIHHVNEQAWSDPQLQNAVKAFQFILRSNRRLHMVLESGDPEGLGQWRRAMAPSVRRNRLVRGIMDGKVRLPRALFRRAIGQQRNDTELLALLLRYQSAMLIETLAETLSQTDAKKRKRD